MSFPCRLDHVNLSSLFLHLKYGIRRFFPLELPGLVVIFLTLVIYWLAAPAFVLGGDNGEFLVLSRYPGAAHPPGYPLYVLYLNLMSWLPGSVALSAARATALLGGVQIALLYIACRVWGNSPTASALATAGFAGSYLATFQNTHAEVFALHGVLCALILICAGFSSSIPPLSRAGAVALTLGLGLAHHHSIVLLAPLILYVLCLALYDCMSCMQRLKLLGVSVLALVAGFSFNFLMFLSPARSAFTGLGWGDFSSFSGFIHHFLRADYGTLSLASGQGSVDVKGQLGLLADSIFWVWHLLLPVSVLGIGAGVFIPQASVRRRILWGALGLTILLAGPVFVSRFNLAIIPPGQLVFERFHLLPAMLLAVPVAHGIQWFSDCLRFAGWSAYGGSADGKGQARVQALVASSLILFLFWFNQRLAEPRLRASASGDVHYAAVNGLTTLPRGAFLLVQGDFRVFSTAYLQSVLNVRSDIKMVVPSFWKHRWYRERFQKEDPAYGHDLMAILVHELRKGAPVYLDLSVYNIVRSRNLLPGLISYQHGVFRRILLPGSEPPDPEELLLTNQKIFRDYQYDRPKQLSHSGWSDVVLSEYQHAWLALADDLRRSGRDDLAQLARATALDYAPCYDRPCRPYPTLRNPVASSARD